MSKIGKETYPEQFGSVGDRVLVAFKYDIANPLPATVLRDEAEDGRIVMGSECQWSKAPSGVDGTEPAIPVYKGHR